MPTETHLEVKDLFLDLRNFRTVPQRSEAAAIKAILSIDTEYFWALAESLIEDGFLPTENVIVLHAPITKKPGAKAVNTVKEGNRRIAILKILHRLTRVRIDVPAAIASRIADLDDGWRQANSAVPCAVFNAGESDKVDRIVTLVHGKSEKAGRLTWNSVARARHQRDKNQADEPGLDVLEKYIKHGQNCTPAESERWAGDYPLSLLDEVLPKLYARFQADSVRNLVDRYPVTLPHRSKFEDVMRDIGHGILTFPSVRTAKEDIFEERYGLTAVARGVSKPTGTTKKAGKPTTKPAGRGKANALSWDNPDAIKRQLVRLKPKGRGREKIVVLLEELRGLRTDKHPHAFCFLLRSIIELSAKAYCDDRKAMLGAPTYVDRKKGFDRPLVDVLRDIAKFEIGTPPDKEKQRMFHSVLTELAAPDGFLSITSFNQLVHGKHFVADHVSIGRLFGRLLPLLEVLNC